MAERPQAQSGTKTGPEAGTGKTITVSGGCHCGAVRFRFPSPPAIDVTDCTCSICTMTGFRHVFVPHAEFELRGGAQDLVEYTFNTHTARHLFCGRCGVKSFYQPRSHPDAWSVNLACLAPGDWHVGEVTTFDGANWEANIENLRPSSPSYGEVAPKGSEGV